MTSAVCTVSVNRKAIRSAFGPEGTQQAEPSHKSRDDTLPSSTLDCERAVEGTKYPKPTHVSMDDLESIATAIQIGVPIRCEACTPNEHI